MNPIDLLIQSLMTNATQVRQPLAATIPGWMHDLITERLRSRGVVFTMKNKYGPASDEEGHNNEGRWIVKTERFSNPHSVILFQPTGTRPEDA